MSVYKSDPTKIECPEHPWAFIIEDYRAGDQICSQCGLVVGDRTIDVGVEWRTFSDDKGNDDPSRVGGRENPLMPGSGLSTIIGAAVGGKVKGAAASVESGAAAQYSKRSTMSSADRRLMNSFQEIGNMSDRLNLSQSIRDKANYLYKTVHDGKSIKVRSKEAIAAACVFLACRQENVPRTFKELCAVCKVSKTEIGRTFKLLLKALGTSGGVICTDDFMSRFCSNLSLPRRTQMAAIHIAQTAGEMNLVPGRSPISVAAAAIYMASQASEQKRSSKEIGEVAGVAESTIRQSYKLMLPKAKQLFPDNFEFHTPVNKLPVN